MDINSNQRKLSSREDRRAFSQSSVLSAMDRFVHSVDNMNATVMVPIRLMDMSMHNASAPSPLAGNTDMYSFYSMLNAVKTELLWSSVKQQQQQQQQQGSNNDAVQLRRMSTVSSFSLTDSDADSESCSESDSGVEYEDDSAKVAAQFRMHLTGLYQMLEQLADSANYVTNRYQTEVVGTS